MKRLRIVHLTEYRYNQAVAFSPHRVLVRPREGHDLHIESSLLVIEPRNRIRWLRDPYGNCIAVVEFAEKSALLKIMSDVVVNHYVHNPLDFVLDPAAQSYPFQYSMEEQPELLPYRLASYPLEGEGVRAWLDSYYQPGQGIGTLDLLTSINRGIFEAFSYQRREEPGVQPPLETLRKGSGSCRDFATFLMEAVRNLGFAARFVSGYLSTPPEAGQHGSTHAWTEIYIPGAGWLGFDPTSNILCGEGHVSVAVARNPAKAAPVSGSWIGVPEAFQEMNVTVDVRELG